MAQVMNWIASMMFVQFLTRMFHFLLNILVVRRLTTSSYGISSIQLPFISSLVTRILRETVHRHAVREAHAQSETKKNDDNNAKPDPAKHLVLVWWSIPTVILFSSVTALLYLYFKQQTIHNNPWVLKGFVCWLLSSWVEMATEPFLIYIETTLKMNVGSALEGIALVITSICSFAMLYTMNEDDIVLLQSYSQLIHTTSLLLCFLLYVLWTSSFSQLYPRSFRFNLSSLMSLKGFFIQSLGKLEIENIILILAATDHQQGVFSFVHNLGSIVARVLFFPIERTSYILFTKHAKDDVTRLSLWKMTVNLSLMISLLYLATCPNYVRFLVGVVWGEQWINESWLLSLYGVYLLIMGLNGLVESLRDAVSPYKTIDQQTNFLLIFSFGYVVLGCCLMSLFGAAGLIISLCINTLIRMTFNIRFFQSYLFPITEGLPPLDVWSVYGFVFVSGWLSRQLLGDSWKLIGVGVVQGVLVLGWLLLFQRQRLNQMMQIFKRKQM